MSRPLKKVSVHEYARQSIARVRNRIVLFGVLALIPLVILLGFYSEYSSLSQTLIPVTRQMAQAISLGDEIALQRISDSLTLIPQVSAVQVYLEDGTCAAESKGRGFKENWSSSIQDPCQRNNSLFELSMTRKIGSEGMSARGTVKLFLKTPWNYILFAPVVFMLIVLVATLFTKLSIQRLVLSLVKVIDSLSTVFAQNKEADFEFLEIDDVYRKLLKLKELELQVATDVSLQKAASQVSHDIRSPLSALEMILPTLEELPEQKRVIVRNSVNRIRDIANDLLNRYRRKITEEVFIDNGCRVELLMPLIDSIVSEKRIEFRKLSQIEILFFQSKGNYGLFSSVNVTDLKRVLSNLINNAIEAIPDGIGKVKIDLSADDDWIFVTMQDTGIGIPGKYLQQVGKRGFSFNKIGGSGLGLSGAMELIQSWGGNIDLASEEGKGTIVKIKLKKAETPSWFVSKIALKPHSTVIALDDDLSIHRIWQGKLDSMQVKEDGIELKCFSSTMAVRDYYRDHFADLEDVLFLIDYELIGSEDTGLDLIEQLGIQNQSILVTSRYEEDVVRAKCDALGIKLIPKSMSGFVPIGLRKVSIA